VMLLRCKCFTAGWLSSMAINGKKATAKVFAFRYPRGSQIESTTTSSSTRHSVGRMRGLSKANTLDTVAKFVTARKYASTGQRPGTK
jgi:hypothetical protein